MDFITSDWHFGHRNICGPEGFVPTRTHFENTEEMNDTMIAAHNAVVGPLDTTIHLGDTNLNMKPTAVHELLRTLNGHFIFVKGNHDDSKLFKYLARNNYNLGDGNPKYLEFHEVGFRRKANGKVYLLSHYPLGLGERRKKLRNLCGHIHEDACREANQLNVGVDSPEIGDRPFGTPLPLEEAMALVDAKWQRWFDKEKRILEEQV